MQFCIRNSPHSLLLLILISMTARSAEPLATHLSSGGASEVLLAAYAVPEPPPLPVVQVNLRRSALGIEIGGIRYSGDIDDNSMFTDASSKWNVYANVLYKYRLYAHRRQYYSLLLRVHAGVFPLKGTSTDYSFTNTVFGGGVGIETEFFLRSSVRPYLFLGAGAIGYLPNTSFTEFFERRNPAEFRGSSTVTAMFPAGGGINIQVGRQADIFIQFAKTITLTDNLDGWESGIMDNFQTIGLGFLYYFR